MDRGVSEGLSADLTRDNIWWGKGNSSSTISESDKSRLSSYTYWHNRDGQNWVYSIFLMTRSRTTIMVLSPPKFSTFLNLPGYQHFSKRNGKTMNSRQKKNMTWDQGPWLWWFWCPGPRITILDEDIDLTPYPTWCYGHNRLIQSGTSCNMDSRSQ